LFFLKRARDRWEDLNFCDLNLEYVKKKLYLL